MLSGNFALIPFDIIGDIKDGKRSQCKSQTWEEFETGTKTIYVGF